MKRSITRWTTTLATAAVLGLPAVGLAQSPSTTPPRATPPPPAEQPTPEPPSRRLPAEPNPEPPTQPTPQPAAEPPTTQPPAAQPPATQPTTSEPRGSAPGPGLTADASPEEHLRQAKAALDAVPAGSLTGRAKAQVAELKRHMTALERASSSSASAASTPAGGSAGVSAGKAPKSANANWGTEVAAMDKLLTELLGTAAAASSGSGTPRATGTSGATAATGTSGSSGKAPKAEASTTLDEPTRARLLEVRTHITAYAAAKAGSPTATPKGADTSSPSSPTAVGGSASAQPSTATPDSAGPSQEGTSAPSAAGPAVQAQDASQPAQPGSAEGTADADAARQALTTARDTLSQLTQLPAAAQLSGEVRTQVAQLISNFNELITTQSQWRASYGKVTGNLDALLGAESGTVTSGEPAGSAPTATTQADAPSAGAPAPSAGATGSTSTPGAVGTSGAATVQLDPGIREKLIELRRNLSDFEKASGGATK